MNTARRYYPHNFYVTGGTLRRDAASYVTRAADGELYEGLRRGDFCYVLTARQMGKSSLMVRAAARLCQAGASVAVLDLTALGQNLSAEQWYYGLLGQLGRQLNLSAELKEFWLGQALLGPLQRWMAALREVLLARLPGRMVIFIDEIDAVRSLPFSTDEFFAGIRELYNERAANAELTRLTFCLLGVATPSDLVYNPRLTPFNIGQRVELPDFTHAESLPLAQGLRRDEKTNAQLLRRVLHWTSGHPYLTQRLCKAVAESEEVRDGRGVDQLCAELFLSHGARERDDNLIFVRDRLLRGAEDLAGLLTLYGRVRQGEPVRDDETNPLTSVLRLSGVTRVARGQLKLRNWIYASVFDRDWVRAHMPDAELRRLRAAYQRGLWRAAAVAMVVVALIAWLAFIAVQQRNRATMLAQRADHNLRQAQQSAVETRRALTEAELQRQAAEENQEAAERQRGQAVAQRQIADEQRARAEQQQYAHRRLLYAAHMNLLTQDWEDGNLARMDELLNTHVPGAGEPDWRGFEWYYLWRLAHGDLFTLRYAARILALAVAPDNRTLAIGAHGQEGGLILWDLVERRARWHLKAHGSEVVTLAFAPDGRTIATGGLDRVVRLWEAATGRELAIFAGHTALVRNVAFAPDGRRLATCSDDRTIRLWDVAAGQAGAVLRGHENWVWALAFAPDGQTLATAGEDHTIRLWDVATGQQSRIIRGHTAAVYSVAFSHDGRRLATGSNDRTMRLWEVGSGRQQRAFNSHQSGTFSVAFLPGDQQLVTTGEDHTAKLWDAETGHALATIKGHAERVWSQALTPDGRTLITGSQDGTVKFWDLAAAQDDVPAPLRNVRVNALAFAPDGKHLALVSHREVKLLTTAGDAIGSIRTSHPLEINTLAFSPDGTRLATVSDDGAIELWDVAQQRRLKRIQGHSKPIVAVAFSPDGRRLVTGSRDHLAKLWDAATGRALGVINAHTLAVRGVAFSPDGQRLITASNDETIRIWDAATLQERATLVGHTDVITSLDVSRDGQLLATSSDDRTLRLWNATTGRALANFKGHISVVVTLAFAPGGQRVATGDLGGTVKLWDLATGQELMTLRDPQHGIRQVAFSPDGTLLAAVNRDYRLRLWRAAAAGDVLARGR